VYTSECANSPILVKSDSLGKSFHIFTIWGDSDAIMQRITTAPRWRYTITLQQRDVADANLL